MKSCLFAAVHALGLALTVAAEPAPSGSDVVGRLGDLSVSADDVRGSLAALGGADGAAIRSDPALLSQVVRSLLVQRLLLREAESKGHDRKPEVIAQLAKAREVALTESYLQSVSEPSEQYPGEAELQAAYEKARPQIGVPKSFRLAQIFVSSTAAPEKGKPEKPPQKLEAVQKALREPAADFGRIAAAHSEETVSAGRNGEIGWLAETQIQPEIREKLGTLKVDGISEPIRLNDGWHIVKLLDARAPYTPTLDQVRSQLITQLRAEKTKANSQAYLAKLLETNPVAINEIALGQIVEPARK